MLVRFVFGVMPGLVPGIHVLLTQMPKPWMAGTSPAMTKATGTAS
jgi:hypothetical protein